MRGRGLNLSGSDRGKLKAVVNAVMNIRVLKNSRNFLTSCGTVRFSRKTLFRGVICV